MESLKLLLIILGVVTVVSAAGHSYCNCNQYDKNCCGICAGSIAYQGRCFLMTYGLPEGASIPANWFQSAGGGYGGDTTDTRDVGGYGYGNHPTEQSLSDPKYLYYALKNTVNILSRLRPEVVLNFTPQHASNQYELPENNQHGQATNDNKYGPPKNKYVTPTNQYYSPTNKHPQQANEYAPPKDNYGPSTHNQYVPSVNNYLGGVSKPTSDLGLSSQPLPPQRIRSFEKRELSSIRHLEKLPLCISDNLPGSSKRRWLICRRPLQEDEVVRHMKALKLL